MKNFSTTIFTDRNALKVNEYLQLDAYPSIFVGGDINSVREEKTAANAERHARVIVKNIDRTLKNKPLVPYKESKGPLVISLGDRDGVIVFRKLVITGLLPRIIKYLIAWWVLRQYKWSALLGRAHTRTAVLDLGIRAPYLRLENILLF